MTTNPELKLIVAECIRLEEDATHSAKGHFNAEALWGGVHLWIGVTIAIVAAAAGISFFSIDGAYAGYLAFIAALLSGTNTALNPEKLSASHGVAGRKYNSLKNNARIFRSVGLNQAELAVLRCQFETLCRQRDDLNEASPGIPRSCYKQAKKDIENGDNEYKIDAQGD